MPGINSLTYFKRVAHSKNILVELPLAKKLVLFNKFTTPEFAAELKKINAITDELPQELKQCENGIINLLRQKNDKGRTNASRAIPFLKESPEAQIILKKIEGLINIPEIQDQLRRTKQAIQENCNKDIIVNALKEVFGEKTAQLMQVHFKLPGSDREVERFKGLTKYIQKNNGKSG